MAAWHDLIQRIEALEERGLTVATDYHGQGLPKWLQPALGDCDVFVLNAKGVSTNDTLCIVRLARLEELVEENETARLLNEIVASEYDRLLNEVVTSEYARLDELLDGLIDEEN